MPFATRQNIWLRFVKIGLAARIANPAHAQAFW
jgi:hypothetical protein